MGVVRNIIMFLVATMLVACQGASSSRCEVGGDTLTTEAELLTIVECNGIIIVDI